MLLVVINHHLNYDPQCLNHPLQCTSPSGESCYQLEMDIAGNITTSIPWGVNGSTQAGITQFSGPGLLENPLLPNALVVSGGVLGANNGRWRVT